MTRLTAPAWPDLAAALADLVRQIPSGRVTTFGDLAEALGDLSAARWVATWIGTHIDTNPLPLHRVVRRSGELARWQPSAQARLLEKEGVPAAGARIDLAAYRWRDFQTARPLQQLAAWQHQLADAAQERPWSTCPRQIGGVDLSYISDTEAVAAFALVDVASGELVASTTLTRPTPFPYLPGYLTFRELPLLLELLDDVGATIGRPELLLVDGSGRLHPRRAGIAVAVGVLSGVPTIGVAKHQLCGQILPGSSVDGCPVIAHDGTPVGAILEGGSRRRTLYVSPGDGVDLPSAVRLVRAVWRAPRLPLPIDSADRLSRAAARDAKRS